MEIPERSIKEIIEDFKENLVAARELGNEFMYQTLMEFGNKLGDFPLEQMTEDNKIHGCQSTVYISGEKFDDRIYLKGFADSKLVKGEVAILIGIFNGQLVNDVVNNSKNQLEEFIKETKIIEGLTPSRQNAFGSMYEHIKKLALW